MNPNKQETREDHEDEDEEDVTASIGEGRLSLQSLPVGVSRAFNQQKTQESQQETHLHRNHVTAAPNRKLRVWLWSLEVYGEHLSVHTATSVSGDHCDPSVTHRLFPTRCCSKAALSRRHEHSFNISGISSTAHFRGSIGAAAEFSGETPPAACTETATSRWRRCIYRQSRLERKSAPCCDSVLYK